MVLRRNGDGGGGVSVVTDRGKMGTIENGPPMRRDHKNKTEPYVGFR